MTGMRWLAALLLAALAVTQSIPAYAVVPGSDVTNDVLTADPIATDPAEDEDLKIADRLSKIYGSAAAFENVAVTVDNGVVTLSGIVSEDADIEQAENTAQRTDGVVLVQNNLERNISVEEGLGIFGKLAERASDLFKLLPLLLLSVMVGLAIAVTGYVIAGFGGLWRKVAPNVFLAELIQSAIRFAFVIGGVVIALDILGATALLGAVLGGAGVIGIALGFAMRDTVENYVASLMLSLRQPFRANDHVLIDDMEGRVIRLTSRATVLMTLDGNHLRIPNSTVFKGVILNYTRNPQRRFDFELGIDADDDPNAARRLGRAKLAALPFVLDDPAPEARTLEVGDSNIVIRFLGWIDQTEADWHKARSRAIAVVKTALEDAGFALPEPIYRLRFDARSEALSFANVDASVVEEARGKESERSAKAATAEVQDAPDVDDDHNHDHDVAPEDEVARMVDAERAAEPGESDLLDSGRPVE